MSRYDKILDLIKVFQPESVIEIGTWNGSNAIRMLQTMSEYTTAPQYFGYDLFEEATEETDKAEFNVKPHHSILDVGVKIKEAVPNATVNLKKGNTRETLKPGVFDFAYIDGGHSIETIRNDYDKLKHSSVVVFDDYYLPDSEGKIPDIKTMGCNLIVKDLPHAVIDTRDPVKGGGITALAIVFGA